MRKFVVNVNGKSYEVEVEEVGGAPSVAPVATAAPVAAPVAQAPAAPAAAPVASAPAGATKVEAPMPGTILRIDVKAGDSVNEGDVLCILEAMKMENEIVAPAAGTVASINVNQGQSVNSGDLLVSLS